MIFEMVAGKTWIAGNSGTIGKIHNAAGEHFGFIGAVHELIRGSLYTGNHSSKQSDINFDNTICIRPAS
jgi:hypothetical protein